MNETETVNTGLVFAGTHYGADGDYQYVEVLGGPATVERFADAIAMRPVPSVGRAVTLTDGGVLLACHGDCVEAALRCEWGRTVPDGTRVRVDAWPCVGEECHGCAGGAL